MPFKDPIKRKEYNEQFRKKYQKEIRERNKKWAQENKEYLKKYHKEYREKYRKGTPEYALYLRSKMLIKNYGINIEQYDEILKKQNGVCAICGKPPSVDKNGREISLAVDHHHKYNGIESIRGLLCWTCNRRLISNLGDRENAIELFQKAVEYLQAFEKKKKSRE
jgi:hypothetical protein